MRPCERAALWFLTAAGLRLALSAPRSQNPQLEQEFSDWYQSYDWHEEYRVEHGRGAMWRQWTTDHDPLAICNDGSPGLFYVRRGQGQGLSRWLVRFQGAQYCWDAKSCHFREDSNHSSFLTTSKHAPEWISNMLPQDPHIYPWMLKAFGILNVDPILNPLWHNWNHVYLFPCSSDAFLGDAPATDAMPWHFRGRRCLFSAFQMLLDKFQLAEARDVLLVGDSTGGAGVMQVVDDLQELVTAHVPSLQRFKAFIDGGWMFPAQQLDGGEFFFSPHHLQLLQQNTNAAFNRKCSEHYPDEPWVCFYAPNVWPHVETPLLFHHCLYDYHLRLYLLGENTSLSHDPVEWEKIRASYTASFRLHEQQTAAMSRTERMALQTSQPGARQPTLFAPACTFHQMTDADYLTATSQVGQLLFMEVFKDWYLGFEEELFIIDGHPGVRNMSAPRNEAQWNARGLQYFKFVEDRRASGLSADISETEPPFLMQPLPAQADVRTVATSDAAATAADTEAIAEAATEAATEASILADLDQAVTSSEDPAENPAFSRKRHTRS